MAALTGYSGAVATTSATTGARAAAAATSGKATKSITVQREDGLTVQLPDLTADEVELQEEEEEEATSVAPAEEGGEGPTASAAAGPHDGASPALRIMQATGSAPSTPRAAVPDASFLSLLDPRLFDPVPRPGPIVLVQTPSAGLWSTLANCSLANAAASARCAQVVRPGTDVVLLRLRIPARTSVTVTLAPTTGRTDGVIDSPYTFTASTDDVPVAAGDDAAAAVVADSDTRANVPFTASMTTLPLDNCRHVSRDVFMAVGGNNNPPQSRPIAFDVILSGESAASHRDLRAGGRVRH